MHDFPTSGFIYDNKACRSIALKNTWGVDLPIFLSSIRNWLSTWYSSIARSPSKHKCLNVDVRNSFRTHRFHRLTSSERSKGAIRPKEAVLLGFAGEEEGQPGRNRRFHCSEVLIQGPNEARNYVNARALRSLQPRMVRQKVAAQAVGDFCWEAGDHKSSPSRLQRRMLAPKLSQNHNSGQTVIHRIRS